MSQPGTARRRQRTAQHSLGRCGLSTSNGPNKADRRAKDTTVHWTCTVVEQQLVGWYENEEDKVNIKSGGAGSGMECQAWAAKAVWECRVWAVKAAAWNGGYGEGGSAWVATAKAAEKVWAAWAWVVLVKAAWAAWRPKPKPIETQPWEVRMARRQVNQLLQTAHIALDGKAVKDGRVVLANTRPILDLGLPAEVSEPASALLKSVEVAPESSE